ncbi:MAG: alanine--tRNA ligase [Microcoleus sp. PH2017_10_PVI_O_A]|uniref:alanine--tRNA ligase n=1 Tax=unclassified Microcoleus TaxID=2642155 RepID=UPI001D38FBB7|nr:MULTISPECIES: alanine--tRNA ligase [unclassified Microcoleus]TAE78529.1 MAG: alanine--tRNA ligase [Oscillatoriales cyanobacterium]MCC3408177.1 alanine--tRNA ligase [Microcoleus sp. PH2017_10_PVI_O_A]MCC3462867.1 alanine--tRNA ligase [Microcoleus sp. PH2017_11_PCY_U_A]MCC3480721.1 alanine--tRNA ligase [Microcoleus sp. PH2017_12_PCY_D_A]MCC3530647.1 alanine--tRNA ligase [Microcoleus sp. PH2017_21_RUC_O_A]
MSITPKSLGGSQIRQTFLDFYAQRGHKILPSASLVPEDPTVLLTIAGMLQFKPIFLGQRTAESPRATTSQKCIRTNDIENVGRTARHHTFFEMLGNFSFGDYFKKQAIAWAWELSTEVFGLPASNLVVSVFREDDEAFAIWRDEIGIPGDRIQRMGEADNFWQSGPTGPCGPCSEIYYDFHPERGDNIDLEDDSRFIEFYNLVFMQYNKDAEGNLTPLQNQNIDTGMGLERMAQILQKVPNNYETDLIFPIVQSAAEIAGIDYHNSDENVKVSLKVIGDHIRAVVHMIADEIRASNVGRGYILRRLIRRVVRHGRLIGIQGEFTVRVAESAIALSEAAYPNVRSREAQIKAELAREEAQFLKTLERGEKLLEEIVDRTKQQANPQISGQDAFTLYDTYGFPLELTQEIAEEQGITVDLDGFEAAMKEQQTRAKDARQTIDLTVQGSLDKLAETIDGTEFVGYDEQSILAQVEVLLVDGKSVESAAAGTEVQVVLNQTPFYAESGGQLGDKGYLKTGENGDGLLVRVDDVKKESDFFVHFGFVERGTLKVGDSLTAKIDNSGRRRIQANHTATHLLQSALREIVDGSISQAGSLVSSDRLRFDFNSPRAVTAEELEKIEDLVNSWIAEAHAAEVAEMPIAQAREKGATAMFGEKYGDIVRVIDFPGVSMELCGGTHVSNTAEIGLFKIVSEAGVAAGTRRIEAVSGQAVLDYLNVRDRVVRDLGDRFKAKPEELPNRITNLQNELKDTQKQLAAVKSELAIAKSDQLLNAAEDLGEFKIIVAQLGDVDAEALKTAAERLQQKLGNAAVVLASIPEPDKVSLVAAFSPEVNKKGLQAGKFIGGIAQICGGKGGGRPNLAQAGGRDASKLQEALESARNLLVEGLG